MFSFSNIDRYIVSVALLLIALSSRQPLDGLVAFEGGAECFNTKNKVLPMNKNIIYLINN